MNTIEQIEQETESVGRIYTSEMEVNPDILREKIDAKIKSILDKYGYRYAITGFMWEFGNVQGTIDLIKKEGDE